MFTSLNWFTAKLSLYCCFFRNLSMWKNLSEIRNCNLVSKLSTTHSPSMKHKKSVFHSSTICTQLVPFVEMNPKKMSMLYLNFWYVPLVVPILIYLITHFLLENPLVPNKHQLDELILSTVDKRSWDKFVRVDK